MRDRAARIAVHEEEIRLHERRISELRRLIADIPPETHEEPASVLAQSFTGRTVGQANNGNGQYIGLKSARFDPGAFGRLSAEVRDALKPQDDCTALAGADRHDADVFDKLAAQLRSMLGLPVGDADPLGR